MSLKPSLRSRLVADATVAALVGSRIRVDRSEQSDDKNARIVMFQVDANHAHHMTAATGKAITRMQLNCYGTSPKNADQIAEACRLSLDGFRGDLGDVFISMCHLDNEQAELTTPTAGSSDGIYGVQQDYLIGWTVSVPSFA